MSWNRAKCPGKSWKLRNFWKLRFIGIWNDASCSISLKFQIPSTFLGKNFMEINSKMSWKVLEINSKMFWKVLEINSKMFWKVLEINSKMSWKVLVNSKMSWKEIGRAHV